MSMMRKCARTVCLIGALALAGAVVKSQSPPDMPSVTVRGQTYTPRLILARNMGSDEDQTTAFPPHKIIGNVYYVGTRTLSSFLITTPAGHILINSTYERNVRTIAKSVERLGFTFSDVRILLGTHAHGDHQEGDALVKELSGAQVLAMREDVPALEAMKPSGKTHPIDHVLRDGEEGRGLKRGGDGLADVHVTRNHDAVHGRADRRVAEVGLRLVEGAAGLGHAPFRRLDGGNGLGVPVLGGVVIALGDDAVLQELPEPFQVA